MNSERHSRQTFLGAESERVISSAVVAIVGLGGGGSHIVQQLAHIGFRHFVVFDPQEIDESNLNRMVGAVEKDVAERTLKTVIAERVIKGVNHEAEVVTCNGRWQESPELLRSCDVIFGCVDSFSERRELEVCARRYLIPLLDIGMDVVESIEGQPPRMAGQVILSLPGGPCLQCCGFLTEEKLGREAALYGAAGSKPQVVWPNAILASTAIGIFMSMITNWSQKAMALAYFSYDGNENTLLPHIRTQFIDESSCIHFPIVEVGDPVYIRH